MLRMSINFIKDRSFTQLIVIRSKIHHYKLIVWSSMISLTFVNSCKMHVLHQLAFVNSYSYVQVEISRCESV